MAFLPGQALFVGVALFALTGCASLVLPPMLEPVVENLNRQTDIELVCEGAPSFLLMLDSLLVSSPDNPGLLQNGARAYTALAGLMPECGRPERAPALAEKARDYGLRLIATRKELAGAAGMPLADFTRAVQAAGPGETGKLFWGGYAWAAWIGASQGAPEAMADLPRVELIMQQVLALDEGYYHGGAHVFMGIYHGSLPVMLGGRPETSRAHFEKALAFGGRRFLPALVAYAEFYARQNMDRELFVSLLQEALAFDNSRSPDLTLVNALAKRRARKLLAQTDDFF